MGPFAYAQISFHIHTSTKREADEQDIIYESFSTYIGPFLHI